MGAALFYACSAYGYLYIVYKATALLNDIYNLVSVGYWLLSLIFRDFLLHSNSDKSSVRHV
jgi:hypothetical protein